MSTEKLWRMHAVRTDVQGDKVITTRELDKLCDGLELQFEIDGKTYLATISAQYWAARHPDLAGSLSSMNQFGLGLQIKEL